MMSVPCVSTSSRSRGKERAEHYRESLFSRHAPRDRRLGLKIFSPTAEARCSGRPRGNTISREAAEIGSLPTHIFTHYLENVLPISLGSGWRNNFRVEFARSDFSPNQNESQLNCNQSQLLERRVFIISEEDSSFRLSPCG